MSYHKGAFAAALREKLINALAKDGERIMRECITEKEYQNRTGALVSSYGWAVYFHGHVVKAGFSEDVQAWNKKYKGEYISGAQIVTELLTEGGFNFPGSSHSMGLVIVAAVPYGRYLEAGAGYGGKEYKVIAMAYDKLKAAQDKYAGFVRDDKGKRLLSPTVKSIIHSQIQQ